MKKRSERTTDIVVGIFVVLGVAAITAAMMWAREVRPGRHERVVTARFREVGGAGVGTNAYIRGVRAGRIAAIELGSDGWVRARISLERSVPMPDDPVVVLGSANFVGAWQATIVASDEAAADPDLCDQLEEAGGERGVLPGATLPDFRHFTAGAGRILEDVGVVTGRARTAFDDRVARDIRSTFANSQTVSASLASASEALRRTALRVDSASAGGDLQRTLGDAAAAAADFRAAAAELRSLAARGSDSRAALDLVLARIDTLAARTTAGSGTLGRVVGDPSLYESADSLVRDLRALVADIKANPRRYITVRIF
jgi:phospholipid/cholesterol/gamma-HCH transport system substrate-binding protein